MSSSYPDINPDHIAHVHVRDPLHFLFPEVSTAQRILRAGAQLLAPKPMLKAIDESGWQVDPIDYVRSKEEGEIIATAIKFTEGDAKVDLKRLTHLAGSQAAGRFAIAYHFTRWNKSGKLQAQHFVRETAPLRTAQGGKAKYALDFESLDGTTEAQRVDVGGELVETFESELGKDQLGKYSSAYWWSLQFPSGMPDWALKLWEWPAHWTPAELPTLPSGWDWSRVRMWQNGIWKTYSWSFEVVGYTPNVDTDFVFFASEADYVAWIKDGAAPPPDPLPIPPALDLSDLTQYPRAVVVNVQQWLNVRAPYPRATVAKEDVGDWPLGTVLRVLHLQPKQSNGDQWAIAIDELTLKLGWAAKSYRNPATQQLSHFLAWLDPVDE